MYNHNNTTSDSNNKRIAIRGEIVRITYRSTETGYAVVQFKPEDQNQTITVVGYCLNLPNGSCAVVHGNFISHPEYGRQFKAQQVDELQPTTRAGLVRYLGSGLIPGLGEKTAEKIVETFGLDTLNIIKNDPRLLTKIKGISQEKANKINAIFSERNNTNEAERFFVEHEISRNLSKRIIERYGEQAISIVQNDPYRLAFDLQGVGFATADGIALKLGFALDSPERLRGGLYYALQVALDDGHCYQLQSNLIQSAQKLLSAGLPDQLSQQLDILLERKYLTRDEQKIYLTTLYQAEIFVADFIAKRSQPFTKPLLSDLQIERSLNNAATELGISFSAEQKLAVKAASLTPLVVITGGPGCGKTTVIRALARAFTDSNKVLALAAPTGKAAQRMSQITDLPAMTIHRLLRYDPRINRFVFDQKNPIRVNDDDDLEEGELVDAIIIDEASMLDILLAKDLFSAIPPQATLILVGDKDQLPSVGPGRIFNDLVSSKDLKIISLNQLFRRSETSHITTIAHSINSGTQPEIPVPNGVTKSDAYFISRPDTEDCARLVEQLFCEQITEKFLIQQRDITILSPANRGPLGVNELNRRIQNRINPINNSAAHVKIRDDTFRPGDRVCQRVNNYKIDLFGVFNGDLGTVYEVNSEQQSMAVELWDGRIVKYNEKDIGQLSLAYAMTIHRSQGSELPCVIVVLHESHYTLLQRQLLYTAVTRAKKLLIIVGSKSAISIAVRNSSARERQSLLKERIESFRSTYKAALTKLAP